MENFIVSARKYRPSTFDSVVGQLSITTTLKNAIRNNHLAQAYLFCGPRGVGKTTCARIFAKTINCQALSEHTEPCNKCESCISFSESRSYNIHELDAASNNSVDDIRNLIEQVRIPPQIGLYSVYIIDEVHMLSAQAFNAFLKTLEEPPKHAVFILATTEKHKIIPTILSRCQIFDFSRITIQDTVTFLEKISKNERNEYELDGLNIIAQKADGAMRDALSIYDQIVSFSQGNISYKNVIENLNVLDYDYYFKLTDAFIEANISQAFLIFDEILCKGFDAHNFITGLNKHFRDLLVCKDVATIQLMEVGNNIKEKYKLQSSLSPQEFLFESLIISGQCDMTFKSARNQRLHVELTLVQLCQVLNKKKTPDVIIEAPLKQASQANTITATVPKPQTASNTTGLPKNNNQDLSKFINSTPSIKNLLKSPVSQTTANSNELLTANEEKASFRQTPVTEELFKKAYHTFVKQIQNSKPRLYSTLLQEPVFPKENTIEIILSNQNLEEDFTKNLKGDMIRFFRDELKNDDIVIDVRISEIEEGKQLYTPEDKFRYLLTKNPSLAKLKKQFNLDLE